MNAPGEDASNLLESSRVPMLLLDRKMRVRRFTSEAKRAFGLKSGAVGRPLASLTLSIETTPLADAVRDVLAGFEPRHLEICDRRRRCYSLWIRPVAAASGRVDGAVLSMNDITEKRDGITAAQAGRDYAEAIVEAVNDSLLILNSRLEVLSASRFYYALFRTAPGKVVSRSVYELSGGLWNVPALRRKLSALCQAGRSFSGWEDDFWIPNVGPRTLAVSGRVLPRDADGDDRFVLAIEDVSPLKKSAEAAALRKSEARQREFVANVTHELMTPISAIKGFSQALIAQAPGDRDRRVEFSRIIAKNAERLERLVEDLLRLSSVEHGRAEPAPEPLNLRSEVDAVARTLAAAARRRGVTVRCAIPAHLDVSLSRADLRQVLKILGANAIKYNRKRGRVWIEARRRDGRAVVSIRDTGIGIPKQDLPRIFDRFHRAGNARARTARASGLGLSIIKAVLRNAGGGIWAKSLEGRGTTLTFTLPCRARGAPRGSKPR